MTLDDLQKRLPRKLQEISPPSSECPNPKLWSMYDGMATEAEVLHFLYALVLMLKPDVVVETGTYLGYGTAHLALAVKNNGRGHVHTAEPDPNTIAKAWKLLERIKLSSYVSPFKGTGVELIRSLAAIDFAFLDSDCNTRIEEMIALYPSLTDHSMIAVHDTSILHDQHSQGLRTAFTQFANEQGLEAMHFNTPRGLMLFRKKPAA